MILMDMMITMIMMICDDDDDIVSSSHPNIEHLIYIDALNMLVEYWTPIDVVYM